MLEVTRRPWQREMCLALHRHAFFALTCGAAAACSSAQEPARVEIPLYADSSLIEPRVSNLGFEVELLEARTIVRDFTFATAGEPHAHRLWDVLARSIIAPAHAHPGHHQDGDITGQLHGRYVVSWLPAESPQLGSATLLVGSYASANFIFTRAELGDVAEDDPLLGHSTRLAGLASKEGTQISFEVSFSSPEGRELVGVPSEARVDDGQRLRMLFQLNPFDVVEGQTLFDDVDFSSLELDTEGHARITEDSDDPAAVAALNQIRRTFQTHDHFKFTLAED